jgi:hypothetical protein
VQTIVMLGMIGFLIYFKYSIWKQNNGFDYVRSGDWDFSFADFDEIE